MRKPFQRLTEPEKLALAERFAAGESMRAIARDTGFDFRTVQRAVRGTKRQVPAASPPASAGVVTKGKRDGDRDFQERSDGTASVELITSRLIRTLEEAMEAAEVDEKVWRVARWQQTSWGMGHKDKAGVWHEHQLYRVWMSLERIVKKPLADAIESIFTEKKKYAPVYRATPRRRGDVLCLIDMSDVHFGKLAWRRETGQDYDLRIAEAVVSNACDDLLAEIGHLKVDRFLVPFGNDYSHIDNAKNTTTSGTMVDVDGRYAKIYEIALMSFIRVVERLREMAPVETVLVPGNHDSQTSLTMAWAHKCWFNRAPGVSVDVEPSVRKYRLYGNTLFGFEHGDHVSDQQVRDLPALMLKEAPKEMVAAAEFHEWILGHKHSERKFTTRDIDTHVGVVTRFMHSLSAIDHWHCANKFIGTRRAAEAYWYDRESGYKGHALALARAG
jgi:hypothetical protein